RILAGGRVTLKQSNAFYVGVNYAGLEDIPISNSDIDYTNQVITGDGKLSSDLDNVLLSLSLEGGFSSYTNFRQSDKATISYKDWFFDLGTSEVFKPLK